MKIILLSLVYALCVYLLSMLMAYAVILLFDLAQKKYEDEDKDKQGRADV